MSVLWCSGVMVMVTCHRKECSIGQDMASWQGLFVSVSVSLLSWHAVSASVLSNITRATHSFCSMGPWLVLRTHHSAGILTSSLDSLGISGNGLGSLIGVEGNGRHVVDLSGVCKRSETADGGGFNSVPGSEK